MRRRLTAAIAGNGSGVLHTLAHGAAGSFVLNGVGAVLAFLAQLALAHALGAVQYGIYAYVFTWITLLALLSTLGFQTAMLRFASTYVAQADWPRLRGLIQYGDHRVAGAGILVAALLAGGAAVTVDAPELRRAFMIGGLIVPLWALMRVRKSVLRAFGYVVFSAAAEKVVNAVVLIVVGAAGLLAVAEFSASFAVAVTLAGTALGLVWINLMLGRTYPAGFSTVARDQDEYRRWRSTAPPLLLMDGLYVLLKRTDIVLLGLLVDTTTAGIYAIVSRVADLCVFSLLAVNNAFAPTIATLYAQNDLSGLQGMVTATAWWVVLSTMVICLPLFFLTDLALGVFGAEFTAGAIALRILLGGVIIQALVGSADFLLTMTGKERAAAFVFGVAALANGLLNLLLIPPFGLVGAAVATATTTAGWSLALASLVWWHLRVAPSVLGTWLR